MASFKKIMQQKMAVWMILILILAAAYLVVADSNHEHDNNNNEVVNRKLMKLEPQPNCGGLGAYCDLAPDNWCCGTLECKRNPGILDWSGTCIQGSCNGVGQPCLSALTLDFLCCWDLKCAADFSCQPAGSTVSQEAGIMMIGSA
ncbi:hypothetical protein L484_021751 [Morus notabilis]|uniref:Uncharacterized protein n=1 Tax=Morus notabilis TaxID=981085 RepID=W9SKR0_9ROSA|nr:hypothetical protein L484_021751 [Morus notabilis]